jgi:hypothetical protein
MRTLVLVVALSALIAAPALACGPKGHGSPSHGNPNIPAVAEALDALLPEVTLAQADLDKVTVLRTQIKQLVASGKETAARKAEEEAMRILGYRKAWLRCGPGTFTWMKLPSVS